MALCQACLTPQRASCDPPSHGSFLSPKTVSNPGRFPRLLQAPAPQRQRRPWISSPRLTPLPHTLPQSAVVVARAVATPPPLAFGNNQSSKFADVLGSISILHSEAGAEKRAADNYVQMTAEESGRSAEDYERRALLFERGAEMVASSKLKGERVVMELELLQEEVLESDKGRTAADYLRRAQIFSKSAEVFASQFVSDEALP